MSIKTAMTQLGIEPTTFRFVAREQIIAIVIFMSLSLFFARERARLEANMPQLLLPPLSEEALRTALTQNNIFRGKNIKI
jgi:hypothetical protein